MRYPSPWGQRVVALGALLRKEGRRSPPGPTCRVVLDLRGVPWGRHPNEAALLLRQRPGVLDVRIDPVRHRATVLHDSRTSLPELWNWLVAQSTNADQQADGQADT